MNDNKKRITSILQNKPLIYWGKILIVPMVLIALLLGFIFLSVSVAFVVVIFSDNAVCIFQKLLGIENKKEILDFLGWTISGAGGGLIAVGSGLIAMYGFTVLNRRATAQDNANKLTETGHILIEKGHVQDRFKAATEHLANNKISGRIASFYEFFYLARDNKDHVESILVILCAHLRHISNYNDLKDKNPNPTEEVKTLVGILFSSESKDVFSEFDFDLQRANLAKVDFQKIHKPQKHVDFSFADLSEANFNYVDLRGFNFHKAILCKAKLSTTKLQEVNLWKADLQEANLPHANLQEANLSQANLQNAKLWLANMEGVSLREANLQEAVLNFSNLQKAKLQKANLRNANLQEAKLQKAILQEANLQEVNLHGANLQEAILLNADLQGALLLNTNLQGADLQGANFRNARWLESADLSGAKYNDETTFPDGFVIPDGMEYSPI